VETPPGGVKVPGVVTITYVLTVVTEAAGRSTPTVYPAVTPTDVIEATKPVLASIVPANSMPGVVNRVVI
jgi:hypothetical protein